MYGDPPVARIEEGRLVALGAAVPRRSESAEAALASRLERELGLAPGGERTLAPARGDRVPRRARALLGRRRRRRARARSSSRPSSSRSCAAARPARARVRRGRGRRARRRGARAARLERGRVARAARRRRLRAAARRAGSRSTASASRTCSRRAPRDGSCPACVAPRPRAPVRGSRRAAAAGLRAPARAGRRLRRAARGRAARRPARRAARLPATTACAGSRSCARPGSAACSPTTWAWARRCRRSARSRGRTLVVAPTSVLFGWAEQARASARAYAFRCTTARGARSTRAADVTLTSYALLRLDAEALARGRLGHGRARRGAGDQEPRQPGRARGVRAARRASASRSPARRSRTGSTSCGASCTSRTPACSARSRDFRERYARPIAAGEPGAAGAPARAHRARSCCAA